MPLNYEGCNFRGSYLLSHESYSVQRSWRPELRLGDGSLLQPTSADSSRTSGSKQRWILQSVPHERHCASLIARFDADNHDLIDLHIVLDLLGTPPTQ
jgi:hypothetical protein